MASDIEEIPQNGQSRMKRKSGKTPLIESLEGINGVNIPKNALRPVIDLLNYVRDSGSNEKAVFLKDVENRVESNTMHESHEDETSHYRGDEFVKDRFEGIRGSLKQNHPNYKARINKAFSIIGSHNAPKLVHQGRDTRFTVELPGRSTIEREKNLENVPVHIRWVEEARCVPGLIPATWMTLSQLDRHQNAIIGCFNQTIPDKWAHLRKEHVQSSKAKREGFAGSPLGKFITEPLKPIPNPSLLFQETPGATDTATLWCQTPSGTKSKDKEQTGARRPRERHLAPNLQTKR